MQRGKGRRKNKVLSLLLAVAMVLSSLSYGNITNVKAEETVKKTDSLERQLIPKPLEYHQDENGGKFVLEDDAAIYVGDDAKVAKIGEYLQGEFKKSTGFTLPVKTGTDSSAKDILLALDGEETLGNEGYTLKVDENGIKISAYQPEGVFNGVQTLRQLFPAEIESTTVETNVEWAAPYCDIMDKPEYEYRGMMLDVARHFFPVESVKRQIDEAAKYKINKLHLHMTDDQGWRLEIKGEMYGENLDKLREIGASRSCATNGYRPGQYTQEQFQELAEYAAERYIEIIPEFDMPSHTWAALVSLNFLNSTADGKPHAPGYDNTKPYDGYDVGFCTYECHNEKTYEFIEEVIKQVAPLYPSKYIHIGGDEAHSTSAEDYAYFCNRVTEIAKKYGKTPIGWQNYDNVVEDKENTVTQFWSTGNAQFKDGIKYIVSTADHAYMDMKYNSSCPYGLTWASMNPIDDAYNWDPTDHGSKDQIVGVEAPMFGETLAEDAAWDYMIYPRLMGHAEIGWTPKEDRVWEDYRSRMIAHGERLKNAGVKFYEDEDYWTKPSIPVSDSWTMNEGEGNVIQDADQENPGTIAGDVQWIDGKYGKGLKFNGGYVDLNLEGLKKEWTASLWVNREDNSHTNSVLLSGDAGEIKLEQYKDTNKVGLTEFGVDDWTFDYEAPIGEWVHLTFVSDGTKTSLYVNGELTDSINHVIQGPVKRIGANTKSDLADSGSLKGSLDDLKIINRALTEDEVKDLMNEGNVPLYMEFLDEALAAAEKVNLDEYVTAGKDVFEAAKAAAAAIKENGASSQGEINKAAKALDDARLALKPKADKTILTSIIDKAQKLVEDEYTEDSWAVLEEKLAAAEELQNNPELSTDDQKTISDAVDALNQAIEGLVKKGEKPLQIHMNFDEGEGTTVADSEGAYTGTLTGSVEWVDGKYGKALAFDEGYVDLGINDVKGSWTIGMWVKREDNDRTNTALISGNTGELKLEQWKNTKKVGLSEYGVNDWTFEYAAPAGEWVHLAFVGADNKTALYVNGEKQGEIDHYIAAPTLFLGANARTDLADRGYLKGAVDDLKIYQGALSEDQIKEMMKNETSSEKISTAVLEYALTLADTVKTDGVLDSIVEKFNAIKATAEDILARANAGDETLTQEMVDKSWMDLIQIMQYFSFKQGDKTDLEKVVALAESLDLSLYLSDGQDAFKDALKNANDVLASGDSMQEDVDAAWRELLETMSELRLKPNKDMLETLILSAEGLSLEGVAADDAAMFTRALADARTIYANEEATEEEVTGAVDTLRTAIDKVKAYGNATKTDDIVANAKGTSNASNTANANADKSSNTEKATNTNAQKSVKTGDMANMPAVAAVMLVAAMAAIVAYTKKKEER